MSNIEDTFEYNNEEEAEVAQINTLIANMNAVAAMRDRLAEQARKPSAEFCEKCGEDIPEARRAAIKGVQMCISCQQLSERRGQFFATP